MKKLKISGLALTIKRGEAFLLYRQDDLNAVAEFGLMRTNPKARLAVLSKCVKGNRDDVALLGLSAAPGEIGIFPDYAIEALPGVRMAITSDAERGDMIFRDSIMLLIDADRALWGIVRGSVAEKAIKRRGGKLVFQGP